MVSWTHWVGVAGGTGNTLLGALGGAGQCLDLGHEVPWGSGAAARLVGCECWHIHEGPVCRAGCVCRGMH